MVEPVPAEQKDTVGMAILRGLARFGTLALITMLAPMALATDALLIGQGTILGISVTKIIQDLLLFFCVVVLLFGAVQQRKKRGFFILCASLAAGLLSWEQTENTFGPSPAFFKLLTLAIAIVVGGYVLVFQRKTLWEPLAIFLRSRAYTHLQVGLAVLLFSQFFGSSLLHELLMPGAQDVETVTTIVREGLELFSYLFLLYAAALNLNVQQEHQTYLV